MRGAPFFDFQVGPFDEEQQLVGFYARRRRQMTVRRVQHKVIVTHSAWPTAIGQELGEHRWAFVEALAAAVRD